ncbi:MAG: TlpA disulfide reductase family protein [Nocardioides sp.]
MGVTACNGLQGTGDKGYVTGDGVISTIAVDQRTDAVSFTGEDLDGNPLSFAQFRGRPVVVVVWGSWCTECIAEAKDVEAAAEALKGKAQFVGIDLRDGSTSQAKGYVRDFGIDYPSFYSPDGAVTLAFGGVLGPKTIPAFVVLDAHGQVAATIIGKLPSTQTLVDLTDDVASGTTDG